ncbi:MAG: hypothetical protein WAL84_15050 [Candidatus Dormiibacterota bacterium]
MPAIDNPDNWQDLARQVCAERHPKKLEALIHKLVDALDREHSNCATGDSKVAFESKPDEMISRTKSTTRGGNLEDTDANPYFSSPASAIYQDPKDKAC